MQACGFQIIQTLRAMNLVNRLGYLQFDKDDVFDEKVYSPTTSRFIDFLKEPSPQRVEHRQGAANDSFGQGINPVLAGIHLRVLRVLRFHFPCLLSATFPSH